jgi:hypothetical protein
MQLHRNDRLIVFIGLIIVVIALIGAAIGGTPKLPDDGGDEVVNFRDWPIVESVQKHVSGSATEQSDEVVVINITEMYITKIYFTLNWLDEAPATGLGDYTNEPDEFNFTVLTPWDEPFESEDRFNEIDAAGVIELTVAIPEKGVETAALGEWEINIHCGICGNHVPRFNVGGVREIEDNGNDWVLTYYYEFHSESVAN